jgi:putative ABC transport system permease protein
VDRLRLDILVSWRSLWKRRGSTAAIVILLGLGIGFAATMFALADPFITRPLPYKTPDELVLIRVRPPVGVSRSWSTRATLPRLREWRARHDLFQSVAYVTGVPSVVRVRRGDSSWRLNLFFWQPQTLEILGQNSNVCQTSESLRCGLLTQRAVKRYYGADRAPLGDVLPASNGTPLQIAGTLPQSFVLPSSYPGVVDGVVLLPDSSNDLPVGSMSILARRQPHVSTPTLEKALAATLKDGSEWTVTVESLEQAVTSVSRTTAWGALAAAALVLVICAASVTNLLFSRAFHRRVEFSTRTAIGATPNDLARLVATELTLLTITVSTVGILLAAGAIAGLRAVMPAQYGVLGAPQVTLRLQLFAVLTSVITMAISAVFASIAMKTQRGGSLIRPADGAHAGRLLRFGIVCLQSALAMVLVTGTIVLGRSYLNLYRQDTGFSQQATLISVSFPSASSEELRRHIEGAVDRLQHVQGVERAAATSTLGGFIEGPSYGAGAGAAIVAGGMRFPNLAAKPVTPNFFDAVGAHMILGRSLVASDTTRSGVVINESMAKLAWPGRSPVGDSVNIGSSVSKVVGVVKDMFDSSLDRRPGPALYTLLEQPIPDSSGDTRIGFVVRTRREAGDLADVLAKAAVRDQPDAVVIDISTVRDRLSRTVAERVFSTLVMSLFAIAAVSVCVAGLIGVVAFVTARRTRELAIRTAIGAQPADILRAVSGDTLIAATAGLLIGLIVSRFASASLQRIVYEVPLNSWRTGVPAGFVMLVLITLAVGITARRALRLPVVSALRQE